MIYTVECNYADAASEPEWNEFYNHQKLPALLSVQGFHTSQRFKACGQGSATYLALHAIDGLQVLRGAEYAQKGGGNFARWQPHITDWHRNLYVGAERAPAVARNAYLLVSRVGPELLSALGCTPLALQAVALDRTPGALWLACLPADRRAALDSLPAGMHAYAPMTAQLRSRHARVHD